VLQKVNTKYRVSDIIEEQTFEGDDLGGFREAIIVKLVEMKELS